MSIKGVKISKLQLIILIILIFGLVIGLILAQRQQILKSKADEDIFNNLKVTGANCSSPDAGTSYCQIDEERDSVTIEGIQKLKELLPP